MTEKAYFEHLEKWSVIVSGEKRQPIINAVITKMFSDDPRTTILSHLEPLTLLQSV
jgi:glycyl-tRNA synthetase beta subunit